LRDIGQPSFVPAANRRVAPFAWWFRAGNPRARYLPNWAYSGRIEIIVWWIPALVIVFLGAIVWIGAHDLDPPRPLESAARPPLLAMRPEDLRARFAIRFSN